MEEFFSESLGIPLRRRRSIRATTTVRPSVRFEDVGNGSQTNTFLSPPLLGRLSPRPFSVWSINHGLFHSPSFPLFLPPHYLISTSAACFGIQSKP